MEEWKALKLGKGARAVLLIAVALVFLIEFLFQRQTFLSLIITLLLFGELCVAYRFGVGTATTSATVASLILAIPTQNAGYMGIFCVTGLLAGIFRPLGRMVTATAFLSGAMGIGVMYAPDLLYQMIPHLLAGAMLFLVVPGSVLDMLPDLSARTETNRLAREAGERQERELQMRLLEQARMYRDLSTAFSGMPLEQAFFAQAADVMMPGRRARYRGQTRFELMHGVARAVGQKEFISGDNYSYYRLSSGKYLIMLSDGMGSGTQAFKDSDQVIGRMEQLLEAGFGLHMATDLVHRWLMTQERQDVGTTLDAGVIDPRSGESEFLKAGAAATYLLRRLPARQVYDEQNMLRTEYSYRAELLSAESTPLGILDELHTGEYEMKLRDGDILVMMTDGVLDAVAGDRKEERMSGFLEYEIGRLRGIEREELTQILSKEILDFAMSDSAEAGVRDDMTILAVGIRAIQ